MRKTRKERCADPCGPPVFIVGTAYANPTLTVTLTGRGVADVEAGVGSLAFGNMDLGSTSAAPDRHHHQLHRRVDRPDRHYKPLRLLRAGDHHLHEQRHRLCLRTGASYVAALTTATQDTIDISTTSQYTVIGYTGGTGLSGHPWLTMLALLSTAGVFLSLRKRRLLPRLTVPAAMLILCTLSNLGCSGKLPNHNEDPTYLGTYTYTFSAMDGTVIHIATYTLTVSATGSKLTLPPNLCPLHRA